MNLDEQANCLDHSRASVRSLYILFCLGLMASLVLLFANRYLAGYLVLGLMLALYFGMARPALKKLNRSWQSIRLKQTMTHQLRQVVFAPAPEGMLHQLCEDAVLPIAQSKVHTTIVRNYLTGNDGDVELMDVTFPTEQHAGGKLRLRWVSGALFRTELSTDRDWNLRLVDSRMMPMDDWLSYYRTNGFSVSPATTDELDAPDGMAWITSPQAPALRVGSAIKELSRLCAYTPGQVLFGIHNGTLSLFISHRVLSGGEPSLKKAITPDDLKAISFPELELILRIVERFNQAANQH